MSSPCVLFAPVFRARRENTSRRVGGGSPALALASAVMGHLLQVDSSFALNHDPPRPTGTARPTPRTTLQPEDPATFAVYKSSDGNAGALASKIRELLPTFPDRPLTVVEAGAGDGTLAARCGTVCLSGGQRPDSIVGSGRRHGIPKPWPGLRAPELESGGSSHSLENWLKLLRPLGWTWFMPISFSTTSTRRLYRHSCLNSFVEPSRSLVGTRRSAAALLGARMLRWLGCNAVTRHDAVRSVHAGFRDLNCPGRGPATGIDPSGACCKPLFAHLCRPQEESDDGWQDDSNRGGWSLRPLRLCPSERLGIPVRVMEAGSYSPASGLR